MTKLSQAVVRAAMRWWKLTGSITPERDNNDIYSILLRHCARLAAAKKRKGGK